MAQNRIFDIFDWKTVTGTVSVPESEFSKIYPQNDGYWYTQDNSQRKRVAWYNDFKNGFITSTATTSVYGLDVNLNIDSGLTFSDIDPTKVLVRGLTVSAFQTSTFSVAFTPGQVLRAASSSGEFDFIDIPNSNGTTDYISKFDIDGTSLVDSRIFDDSTHIHLDGGLPPTGVTGYKYSIMGGNIVMDSKLYLKDNNNFYIEAPDNDNLNIYTDKNFSVIESTTSYKIVSHIDDNSYQTFSFLNGLVSFGHTGSNRVELYSPYMNYVTIGSTDSATYSTNTTFNIFSSATKPLRIVDTTEGLNKLFVSDSDGYGSWQSLTGGSGVITDGLVVSLGLSGYGLSFSTDTLKPGEGGYLFLDYSIFDLNSFTYTTTTVSVGPTIGLSTTGVTGGTYGSSTEIVSLNIGTDGRIYNVITQSFTASAGGFLHSPYDKTWTASNVGIDGGTASGSTMSRNPVQGSYITVYVNGQEFDVGNNSTFSSCYFGTHSTIPKGFDLINPVQAGDYLYWNPSITGFSLQDEFRISVHYLYIP